MHELKIEPGVREAAAAYLAAYIAHEDAERRVQAAIDGRDRASIALGRREREFAAASDLPVVPVTEGIRETMLKLATADAAGVEGHSHVQVEEGT